MSSSTPFDFSDDALDSLFETPAEAPTGARPPCSSAPGEPDRLAPSDEVKGLARSLTGQYVDVIRAYAAQAFGRGDRPPALTQSLTAMDSLLRLARSIDDEVLYSRLDALREHLCTGASATKLERTRFLNTLQDRLLALAEALDIEHGSRLRELIDVDMRATPLLDELRAVPGIGPRRLNRMYCAGLYTVDAVSQADPQEIAVVTGLPVGLARTVVEETQAFERRERERCVLDLQARARQLTSALPRVDPRTEEGRALLEAARHALADLSNAIAHLSAGGNE